MVGCTCTSGLANTGKPNCVSLFGVTSSLIQVPLYANDGTRNGFDLTSTITNTTFTALTEQNDASKRWYPIGRFENVELPKADSQKEEAPSGRTVKLRDGKRSFSGELWAEDSTPTALGKIQASSCVEFGVYIVDTNGSLIGSQEGDMLYPIPVDNQSWDARFAFATDTTTQKIMLMFDIDRLFDESTLYQITSNEGLVDFGTLSGLIDADIVLSSITTTGFTATIKTQYGTAINKTKVKGLVSDDFSLYNDTTSASITITSATESADGVYDFVFSAQASSDDFTLTVLPTSGYVGTVSGSIP